MKDKLKLISDIELTRKRLKHSFLKIEEKRVWVARLSMLKKELKLLKRSNG